MSWCSKKQSTVSLSTTEAEYRTAASAAQEITWLVQLMKDLHQKIDFPVSLHYDNQSATRLAENPVFHARTKHIEIHDHYIREKVLQGDIKMKTIKTEDQEADIFTKNLNHTKFTIFRKLLGMTSRMNEVGMTSRMNEESCYDRQRELHAFDDTKAGVKGLFDSGVKEIPQIFIKKNQQIGVNPDTNTKDLNYSIPVIDLQGLHGDEKIRSEIIDKIRDACENWGFFQVVNHGIGISTLDGILEGVRKFHDQESELKKSLYSRGSGKKVTFYCNYNLFNSPVTDWRDTLSFAMAPNPPEPEELPNICRDIVIDYSNQVKSLGSTLFELTSAALGLDPNHLKGMDCGEKLMMYGLYYPPCPQPELTMGTSKHTDTNSLTILLQDQVSGLEVLHQDKWVDVVPLPGALIVNLGDLMQLITNDKFKSVIHRVVLRKKGKPRVSVACFFGPNGNRVYGPIKELVSEENPPIYEEVTMEQVNTHYATEGVDKAFSVKHFKVVK